MKCGRIQPMSRHASGVASGKMNRVPPAISSSTIRVIVTSPTRHRPFIGISPQSTTGREHTARRAGVASLRTRR
jgi:hypothetical protein